jgi:citronellol/citronellal dehydrogenase
MGSLKGKTLFITGASRGIGLAIALRAARDGANIAIVAKTVEPHPRLPGTIYTAAEEIEAQGGRALPIPTDIRDESQVARAVEKTVETFGGIDILVNNASAIHLSDTVNTPMKRFDLMYSINVRGTFLCSKLCIPYLEKSDNPHILNISPPLKLKPEWFGAHVAYTVSKFDMSLFVLGMAYELKPRGIRVNALWPRTTIATAAVKNLLGGDEMIRRSRKPEIMGEAAYRILTDPSPENTGNFYIDEEVLRKYGITDFTPYAVDPSVEPFTDLFVEESGGL